MKLKEKLQSKIPEWRERVRKLVKEHGDVKVQDLAISQVYGGMRGLKCLATDISYVDPDEGIRMRGYTIPELLERLPQAPDSEVPLLGGLYYLLIVDELPTMEEAQEVEEEWKRRSEVPQYVFDLLRAMPRDTHPMTMFSAAVLAMQRESTFAKRYLEGMKREEYWEPTLEDSLNLTAKLPTIVAYIYRMKYRNDTFIPPDPELDWGGNFGHMMGIPQREYKDLVRLYFLLHADHESGNVSAHTAHLVASGLADIYYAWSAGLDGLAGVLHGAATQESLRWLLSIHERFDGLPTKEQLEQFVWDTLNAGQVIPGYGHAVLRKTDPRFVAQHDFALKHTPDDEIFKIADLAYQVVPPILKELGKVKNPWPNVDALTGTLQYHYGVKEFNFYTLLFGISRALGVTANVIWARILGQPIERPKSLTTKMLEEIAYSEK